MQSWYTESIRLGSTDILASGLHLPAASPNAMLEIVLNNAGATVLGSVVDEVGRPITGISIVAVPGTRLRKRTELFGTDTSDQQGRFRISGLRPGEYTVLALDASGDDLDYYDPELLAKYEAQGKRVHLIERQQASLQLNAITVTEPE